MGLSFSSLFTSLSSLLRWSKDQDVRILMLGLDSAGKVGRASVAGGELFLNFGTHRRQQFCTGYRYVDCLTFGGRLCSTRVDWGGRFNNSEYVSCENRS